MNDLDNLVKKRDTHNSLDEGFEDDQLINNENKPEEKYEETDYEKYNKT